MHEFSRPQSRTSDLVIQSLPNETLVYDLSTHKAHCLNETASFVWDRCDGKLTVEEIRSLAERQFGQAVDIEFVELALCQLHERDLLVVSDADAFPRLGRREAVKKIGAAAAVTLPVIASLAAPPNAFSVAANCTCTSPASCLGRACPSTTNCNNFGLCAAG